MADKSMLIAIIVLGIGIYFFTQNASDTSTSNSPQQASEDNNPSPNDLLKEVKDKDGTESRDEAGSCSDPKGDAKSCQSSAQKQSSTKYSKEQNEKLTVSTTTGLIEGIELTTPLGRKVNAFLGIPFAEPPLGDKRFKPPVPISPWSETIQTSTISKHCHQLVSPHMRMKGFDWWMLKEDVETTEDCLILNIWAPQPTPKDAAVLVWLHGGGFEGGATGVELYDGQLLAAQGDVIVVSINYRLNAFGFLYLDPEEAPGNVGLMDQALGLKWIQENIKSFGGDPRKVTIFGESAGGASVTHHMTIPSSQGLFQRVIAESGTSNSNWATLTKESATEITEAIAEKAGCLSPGKSKKDIINCLRQVDPATIVQISHGIQPKSSLLKFTPVADGVYIPEHPETALENKNFDSEVDIMLGANTAEGLTLLIPFARALGTNEDSYISKEDFTKAIKHLFKSDDETLIALINHYYTDFENPDDLERVRENAIHFGTDLMMLCAINSFSDVTADNGNRVFRYQFSHHPSEVPLPKWTKSLHGDELYFVFGRPLDPSRSYPEEEVELSKRVIGYWANFAKYGDPNGESLGTNEPKWPLYSKNKRAHITIGLESTVDDASNLRYHQCSLWDKLLPQFISASISAKEKCNKV